MSHLYEKVIALIGVMDVAYGKTTELDTSPVTA